MAKTFVQASIRVNPDTWNIFKNICAEQKISQTTLFENFILNQIELNTLKAEYEASLNEKRYSLDEVIKEFGAKKNDSAGGQNENQL